jgi:hypothetical protein
VEGTELWKNDWVIFTKRSKSSNFNVVGWLAPIVLAMANAAVTITMITIITLVAHRHAYL